MMTPTISKDRIAEAVLDLSHRLFVEVLTNASKSDSLWKHRIETFERINLLDFVTPSPIKPKPIEFDESRLDDVRYRRMLVRKLQAPRPSKWARHKLPIYKDRIDDPEYRDQIAKVLAYKWVSVLQPFDGVSNPFPLLKVDVKELELLLDHARLNTISAEWCTAVLMKSLAERLVEENPRYKAIEAEMRRKGAEVRADLQKSLKVIGDETMAATRQSLASINDRISLKAELAIAEIRHNLEESRKRSEAALLEHGLDPNEDREETFRLAVRQREAKMKEERRARWRKKPFWVRMLPAASILAAKAAIFFALEINGATPLEWLQLFVG